MIRYFLLIIIAFTVFSCSDNITIKEEENKLNLVKNDTIPINSNIAVAAINPEIHNDSLLFMMDGGFQDLFIYNLKSGKQTVWDNNYISGTRLPNVALSDYSFADGHVYLYYQGVYSVYQFHLNGNFIKKVELEHPNSGSNPAGGEFLEVEEASIFINQEFDGYNSLQSLFQNSKQIGVYNTEGAALNSFGEFDKQYDDGSIVLTKFNNYLKTDNSIYTLNSVGQPLLKLLDKNGAVENTMKLQINDFNETVYYFEGSPMESKINDQITQLGKDVVKHDSLIYFSYQRYDNEIPPEGYETLEFKLGVLDLAKKSLNTFNIGGNNLVGTTKRMIPQIYDGKIYFLLSPNDTEKEQLILVEAEIQ